jgi:hypothetical protein
VRVSYRRVKGEVNVTSRSWIFPRARPESLALTNVTQIADQYVMPEGFLQAPVTSQTQQFISGFTVRSSALDESDLAVCSVASRVPRAALQLAAS